MRVFFFVNFAWIAYERHPFEGEMVKNGYGLEGFPPAKIAFFAEYMK